MPTLVAFDIDGTLIDSARGVVDSLEAAVLDIGRPAIEPPGSWAVGPPVRANARRLYGQDADDDLIDRLVDRYGHHYKAAGLDHARLFPGVTRMLDALRARRITLAIVTAKSTPGAERALAHFEIRDRFDHVYGADSHGHPSKTEMLRSALDASGCEPSRAAMIGDRVYDVEAGRNNGVWACGVSYGYEAPGGLEQAGADRIVGSVPALHEAIDARLASVIGT